MSRNPIHRELRHPYERPALLLTLLPLALWLVLSGLGSLGWIAAAFVTSWVALFVSSRWQHSRLLAHGVRVGPTQFPHLHRARERCRHLLPVAQAVELVIIQSPHLQAYTFGIGSRPTIVLSTSLLEALDDAEQLGVIAHEWGHLALGHPVAGTLFGMLTHASLGHHRLLGNTMPVGRGRRTLFLLAGTLLLALAPLLFLAYRRCAEFSADRVAVTIVGHPAPVARALAKLAVGPVLAASLDEQALITQADELGRSLLGSLLLLEQDHPFIGSRCRALHQWAESAPFHQLDSTHIPTGGFP